jgi:tetratricopeptide (TPR) repeat protein
MSSFVSSFIVLIAVLAGVTVVVVWLSEAGLRSYRERRTRMRNEEVAEQVKKSLAEMRDTLSSQQQRVDQGTSDFEDTEHEASQRAKESSGEPASQAQGTVGQDAHQSRATEAEPWTTYLHGFIFDRQGEYDQAVEAYQQAIASEHPEAAPRAAFNLGSMLDKQGEYDRAVEAYQQAIASEHSEWTPKAVFNLGVLYEQRGAYEQAQEAYQQAIDSGHPEVAPEAMRNLRGLPMRFPERIRQG